MDVENPLQMDNVPIANLVVLEVEGVPITEPKIEVVINYWSKLWDLCQLSMAILLLLGMIGGFIYGIVWMFMYND
jgi:hypothetical protein